MKKLPQKYNQKESEKKWQNYWVENKIYKWEKDLPRKQIFAIDTPPPTVSGQLHMGHIFSYSQAEIIARYQRMKGKTVFYPIGFDDNGLPTERYVEKIIGKKGTEMPRDEFVKICREKVDVAEKEFEELFKSIGFSFDWDEKYQTISPMSQKIAQMSFIDLYNNNKGVLYRKEEPVIWDVVDQTALAQTEIEDKEVDGEKHYLRFELVERSGSTLSSLPLYGGVDEARTKSDAESVGVNSNNKNPHGSTSSQATCFACSPTKGERLTSTDLEIMTTRPELLPACVAVMICEQKWKEIQGDLQEKYGKNFDINDVEVVTPLGVRVPLIEDDKVDAEKGTGVVMCCTFGDQTDVEWWKKYDLPLRNIINERGEVKFVPEEYDYILKAIHKLSSISKKSFLDLIFSIDGAKDFIRKLLLEKKDEENLANAKCFSDKNLKKSDFYGKDVWMFDLMNQVELDHVCNFIRIFYFDKYEDFCDFYKVHNIVQPKGLVLLREFYKKLLPNYENEKIIKNNTAKKARDIIVKLLQEKGFYKKKTDEDGNELDEWKTEKFKHSVKVGERSKAPVEILVTKQWFVKVLDIKEELHKKADECHWYPEFMKIRMHNWIDGLGWDWCISRQRFSGVPIPVWYSKRKGEEGRVIVGDIRKLPVDPMSDLPEGYTKDEVAGEKDIFDTWFTSSVSPQLSSHGITKDLVAEGEEKRFKKLALPFDLRPQAHEIIRTWAFCTLVKAYYHQNTIPWKNLMISGWCLAADKTKMSKSAGNVITPQKLIEEKGADAVRYWASTANLGADTAYSEDAIKIGNKLINKLWNCAKFGEMHFENVFSLNSLSLPLYGGVDEARTKSEAESVGVKSNNKTPHGSTSSQATCFARSPTRVERLTSSSLQEEGDVPTTPKSDIETGKIYEKVDLWILSSLAKTVDEASKEFENFEYAKARSIIENFFWNDFCDNYLEIVKIRCYGAGGKKYENVQLSENEIEKIIKGQHSAVRTIYHCLKTILKLFAPFIPHITEEIYSHIYENEFKAKNSIHSRGQWPQTNEFKLDKNILKIGQEIINIIFEVRKYKSENAMAMNAEIAKIEIYTTHYDRILSVVEDLKNVTGCKELAVKNGDFLVKVLK